MNARRCRTASGLSLIVTSFFADIFVVTRKDDEMSEIFSRLMESLFQVLAAVTGLDASAKAARAQQDHPNNSKCDC